MKLAKEKCDALYGETRLKCENDANLRYQN